MDELRVKERFRKELKKSRLKWAGHVEGMEEESWQTDQMPRKGRERGDEEGREGDGRRALKDIWEEWEENGEQQQKTEGVGDC